MRNLGYWDFGHEEFGILVLWIWDIGILVLWIWDIGILALKNWDIWDTRTPSNTPLWVVIQFSEMCRSWDMTFLGHPPGLPVSQSRYPCLKTGSLGQPGDRNLQHWSVPIQKPEVSNPQNLSPGDSIRLFYTHSINHAQPIITSSDIQANCASFWGNRIGPVHLSIIWSVLTQSNRLTYLLASQPDISQTKRTMLWTLHYYYPDGT